MTQRFDWQPDATTIEAANVTRLARRHDLDFEALLERSIAEPEWFWDAVVSDLGIPFSTPYTKVCEIGARGAPFAKWFRGGRLNVATACVDRWAADPELRHKPAVIYEGERGATSRWDYATLADETARVAGLLRRLGVRQGEAVGLFMPMCPEIVAAFMAIAKLGAVVVPIFSGFAAPAVATRLADAGAVALLTADGFTRRGTPVAMKQVADDAVAAVPSVRAMVVHRHVGADVPMHAGRDVAWQDAVPRADPMPDATQVDSEHTLMVAYTSGTTGRPKGAVHVHGGFLVKVAAEVAYQTDLRPDELLYWVTDMGWIMGPWEVLGTLALGAQVLLTDGAPDFPDPGRLWANVARHRVNVLGVSPTLVRALIPKGDRWPAQHDLTSLRVLGSTGEPWNPDPWRWYFHHIGGGRCPVVNISGGTEVGACFVSPHVVRPQRATTVGGPSLGMDIDVFDADGRSLLGPAGTAGDVGELVCKQPWPGMTRSIFGDDARYLATYWNRWPDVWVHGDWAAVDADGLWYLHGRSDDTLNIAGKRLGPEEVESLLVSHAAVAEAAAVSVPDPVKGEAIMCFCVLADPDAEPERAHLKAELLAAVDAGLGKAFRPKDVVFVSGLPKTRSAKIVRRAIRATLLGEDPGDLSTLENPHALAAVREAVATP